MTLSPRDFYKRAIYRASLGSMESIFWRTLAPTQRLRLISRSQATMIPIYSTASSTRSMPSLTRKYQISELPSKHGARSPTKSNKKVFNFRSLLVWRFRWRWSRCQSRDFLVHRIMDLETVTRNGLRFLETKWRGTALSLREGAGSFVALSTA